LLHRHFRYLMSSTSLRHRAGGLHRPEAITWDAFEAFKIINTSKNSQTCVGYASSKKRRCENRIAATNRDIIRETLRDLSIKAPNTLRREDLEDVASLSLCRANHQEQIQMVTTRWLRIAAAVAELTDEASTREPSSGITLPSTVSILGTTTLVMSPPPHEDPIVSSNSPYLSDTESSDEGESDGPSLQTELSAGQADLSVPTVTRSSNRCTVVHVARRSLNEDCSICLESCNGRPLVELVWCKGQCGHSFCRACIAEWIFTNARQRCPTWFVSLFSTLTLVALIGLLSQSNPMAESL
jgi:hypothetical protein